MNPSNIIFIFIISGIFFIGVVSSEEFIYGSYEEEINYSLIPTVNNSDYLDGYDSSYFYPTFNPLGFITEEYFDYEDDINLGYDGYGVVNRKFTQWIENGADGIIRWMETSTYGMGFLYDATDNVLRLIGYQNSATPTTLIEIERDTGNVDFNYDVNIDGTLNVGDNLDVNGNRIIDGNLYGANNFFSEAIRNPGMGGLYDRNEFAYVNKFKNVSVQSSGCTSVPSTGNLFDLTPGTTWALQDNDGTYDCEVNVTIDWGGNMPSYGTSFWQPYVQYRLATDNPPDYPDWSSYFKNVSVCVYDTERLGGDWYCNPDWTTTDFHTDQTDDGILLFPNDALYSGGYYQPEKVKFVFKDWQYDSGYTYKYYLWISEIGFRHLSSGYAPQNVKTEGDTMYGDLNLKKLESDYSLNTTISLDVSEGEITAYSYVDLTKATSKSNAEALSYITSMEKTIDNKGEYKVVHKEDNSEIFRKKNITQEVCDEVVENTEECKEIPKKVCRLVDTYYTDKEGKTIKDKTSEEFCETTYEEVCEPTQIIHKINCREEVIEELEVRDMTLLLDYYRASITELERRITELEAINEAIK